MSNEKLIRSPLLSGIFYPSDPESLKTAIRNFSKSAKIHSKPACAIISPHGSFQYSGEIACHAWTSLVGSIPSLIVIAGPAHLPLEDGIFLPESSEYELPENNVKIDVSMVKYLLNQIPEIQQSDLPHLEDHSIEMQLPFASYFFPGVPILPFIVSGHSEKTIATLGLIFNEICDIAGKNAVLVISSDLAVSETPEECDRLSRQFLSMLEENPFSKSLKNIFNQPYSFCGSTIIEAFLRNIHDVKPEVLAYVNSSRHRQGEDEFVVGYAAVSFKR